MEFKLSLHNIASLVLLIFWAQFSLGNRVLAFPDPCVHLWMRSILSGATATARLYGALSTLWLSWREAGFPTCSPLTGVTSVPREWLMMVCHSRFHFSRWRGWDVTTCTSTLGFLILVIWADTWVQRCLRSKGLLVFWGSGGHHVYFSHDLNHINKLNFSSASACLALPFYNPLFCPVLKWLTRLGFWCSL